MADGGVQSPNLPLATTVDSIIGNAGGTTSRQRVTDLAAQLVASDPMRLGTMMGQLFDTADDLPAITVQVTPWVINDPDPDKIGIYKVSGGAWVWALPLPYSIIPATIGDGDTVNVRQLITALPVVDGTAIIIPVVGTNTASPVVVHINGGDAITLKSNSGLDIDEGGLPGAGRLMAIREGAILRLNNDVVATAVVAAAEAAKDLAQTHAAEAAASATAAAGSAASAAAAGATAGALSGATAGAAAGEAAAAPAVTAAQAARDNSVAAAALSTSSAGLSSQKAADAATSATTAQTAAANAQTNARSFATWTGSSGLVSAASTIDAQSAEVLDNDAGTHLQATATGYDGASVPNAGKYSYSAAWSRWVRIGSTGLSGVSNRLTPIEAVVDKSSANLTQTAPSTHRLVADTDTVVGLIGADEAGYAPGVVLSDGTAAFEKLRIGVQTVGAVTTESIDGNYDWSVTDENDNVAIGVKDNELLIGGLSPTKLADYQNKLKSSVYVRQPVSGVQQPTADYNTIVLYGQSLAAGQEAWSALSKSQQFGNVMLGGDVRPTTTDGAGWTQVSPTGFQPLVGKVRDSTTAAILSDAEVAALPAGNTAYGEVPAIGMANMAAWLISRKSLAAPKPFVVICPAVSGRTIEQLSKVNTQDATDRYSRVIQGVTQAHAAATALGKTHLVTAIVWMQGEHDYDTSHGSTKATKALYKAALVQLRNDLVADLKAITGQADDPLFILYQTGAAYVRDVDSAGVAGLHVGMAQLEFALENPGKVVMAGSAYGVTDKGGHLDPNGSRWFGEYLAKAYVRTAIEGRRFRPLSPIKIEAITTTLIRVHFHVPEPPLVFDAAYVVTTPTTYTAKGFRVTDTAGAIGIDSVTIVQDTIVEIVLSRPADIATTAVWYASQTGSSGNGNLRDSDTTIARDLYEYTAGSGQYAAANIAALVDKPYPLGNWAVGFYLPVGYSE